MSELIRRINFQFKPMSHQRSAAPVSDRLSSVAASESNTAWLGASGRSSNHALKWKMANTFQRASLKTADHPENTSCLIAGFV
jgi:hypothetical protein